VALARRIAVALAALVGLALVVLGAWFAFVLGPKGTAAFHATSNAPLVIGPNVLNRVQAPVTVSANAASGPVFVGTAVPQDVDELVGQSKHNVVASASFPARTLTIEQIGSGDLADPSASHIWRATGEGSITVTQDQAPQSVLVYPTQGGSVDVDISVARNTWFLQSLVALVVGLIVLAFAGGWLWQNWRTPPTTETATDPATETPAETPAEGTPPTVTQEPPTTEPTPESQRQSQPASQQEEAR